jgi:hypothetical protein
MSALIKFVKHDYFDFYSEILVIEDNSPLFIFCLPNLIYRLSNYRKNKNITIVQSFIDDKLGSKASNLIINGWRHNGELEISLVKKTDGNGPELNRLDLYEVTQSIRNFFGIEIVFRAGKRQKFPLSNLYYYLF